MAYKWIFAHIKGIVLRNVVEQKKKCCKINYGKEIRDFITLPKAS